MVCGFPYCGGVDCTCRTPPCAHEWNNVDSDGSVWPLEDAICKHCGTRKGRSAGGADQPVALGDSRCMYLAAGLCNKCGRVHDGLPNPRLPFAPSPAAAPAQPDAGVPASDGGQQG